MKRTLAAITLILTSFAAAAHAQAERSAAAPNKPMRAKSGDPYLPRAKSSTLDKSVKSGEQGDAVDQLIERNEQAEGGPARLKIKSRIVRGRVEISTSPLPGSFESYEKAPGKNVKIINAPEGQFIQAADGVRRWSKSPYNLSVTLPEDEGESTESDASGVRPARWKKYFASASIRGRAVVDGREMVVLAATGKGVQVSILMYFDAETWLLRKQEFTGQKPDDENPLKAVYVDSYAVVDGLKLPSLYRQIYKKYTLTFRVVEVKYNVPIDDALFRDPNGK